LTQEANLSALADLRGLWIDRVHARRPVKGIVLDMDSSVSPTFGGQEGTAYNGHIGGTCYHPLLCSISSVTWSDVPCGPATSTPPKASAMCRSRWSCTTAV
jgi:hypothetical protein